MNITFTFKNFEPSDHLKKYARRRMEKLGRFFGKAAGLELQVVMTLDKFRHICDVSVVGEGLHLAATESSQEMYASIDLISDKLESQIKKYVARNKEQRRQTAQADVDVFTLAFNGEEEQSIGTESFSPKPMALEEAVLQLNSIGNDFLVFLNADSSRINVIYRRKNGNYGLIDPVV
ncbi:MAG: ribosome-associated translation inhibitor RaiA [Desulfovibrionaceae bacterium]|jgi:putative sigma-54 modulation protein|nr:ribosome-associated translation inhibitor RaiA [Desulfovibrionaceae bacterium]